MSDPFGMKIVKPKSDRRVVVLDRIGPTEPPYCVHGNTKCIHCGKWCWLGDRTEKIVSSGEAMPLCMNCAGALLTPEAQRLGRAFDRRRSQGPH